MAIEIKITCDECGRTIQWDDVTYCFECMEKLKIALKKIKYDTLPKPTN